MCLILFKSKLISVVSIGQHYNQLNSCIFYNINLFSLFHILINRYSKLICHLYLVLVLQNIRKDYLSKPCEALSLGY